MSTVNLPADKFDTTMTFVKPDPAPTRAPLSSLKVLPGFNTRVKDDDYKERVVGIAESIVAHGFFDDKPFAVVQIPGDDTIYVFDGEHRLDAANQATLDGAEFPDGLPIAWAKDGATVKDLTIHLAHGNNGERLNMVELAAVVRRMQGLKMSKDEIAAALGRTTRHVDNLFVLADANATVKKAVASGQIAGAEAVKLLRRDPATAAAKITEAVKAAEARGKAKATPKTMKAGDTPAPARKTKNVPFSVNAPVGATMSEVLKGIAKDIRSVLNIGDEDKVVSEGVLIRYSVTLVDLDAEAAAAKAAEEKAAKDAERAKAAEVRLAEREAAAKKRAEEKAAKEKAKIAERERKAAEKQEKKEAEAAALKAAAKGAAGAKVSAAEAKARAQAHLGTKADKPASGGKTAGAAGKPAQSKKPASATSAPAKAESAPSGAENPAPAPAAPLPDESMGGL